MKITRDELVPKFLWVRIDLFGPGTTLRVGGEGEYEATSIRMNGQLLLVRKR